MLSENDTAMKSERDIEPLTDIEYTASNLFAEDNFLHDFFMILITLTTLLLCALSVFLFL